jgi:hypothetical protein
MQNSIDWAAIGEEVTKTLRPIREIARQHGISHVAIHKQMEKHAWRRPEAPKVARVSDFAGEQRPAAKVGAAAPVAELTAAGRRIILDLMAELEFLNRNHEILASMVEDYLAGASDVTARAKLIKALNHETRSKTANYLATALAKLHDATPGKKETAEAAALSAGQGSEWEEDLQFYASQIRN